MGSPVVEWESVVRIRGREYFEGEIERGSCLEMSWIFFRSSQREERKMQIVRLDRQNRRRPKIRLFRLGLNFPFAAFVKFLHSTFLHSELLGALLQSMEAALLE